MINMKLNIEFSNNKGYSWIQSNNIYIKGYIFNSSIDKTICDINELEDKNSIVEYIKSLNGCFSIVINKNDKIYAFVDRIRSIPLFYSIINDEVNLFDAITPDLARKYSFDKTTINELNYSLYNYSNHTAINGLLQIPAGYYLEIDRNSSKINRYWLYKYSSKQINDIGDCVTLLENTYHEVFKDIFDYIKNKTVVIPLSGGHDSRLILNLLVQHGCKNIITYSYGRDDLVDAKLSNTIAKIYDVPHYFVQYSKKEKKTYDNIINEYTLFASNFCSVPVVQEIIALKVLLENELIPKDSVVIPGFGGVVTGHYVREDYIDNSFKGDTVTDFIIKYFFGKFDSDSELEKSIRKWLYEEYEYNEKEIISGVRANEIFESYVFQEEQSKFIANAIKTYEFYNLSWIMPFFDRRILEVWQRIDNTQRFSDKAFKEYEKKIYPKKVLDIGFTGSKEINHFHNSKNQFLSIMKLRFKRYFMPWKVHYLYVFFNKIDYYKALFIDRNIDINHFVKKHMLKMFDNMDKKN